MTVQSIANRPTLRNTPGQQSLPQAWGNGAARNGETVVAIIDSGVDASHPDLANSIMETVSFTGEHGDNNGQGTHVAGIIAGNSKYGAETVSFAPSVEPSAPVGQPLQESGSAGPVVAIIDSGADAPHPDLPGSMFGTVSFAGEHRNNNGQGTHVAGIIAGKSNFGAETVSLEPPVKLSTPKGQPLQGSGFAAPVVTGLAATLAGANPDLTGEELKNKLMELDIPAYIGR